MAEFQTLFIPFCLVRFRLSALVIFEGSVVELWLNFSVIFRVTWSFLCTYPPYVFYHILDRLPSIVLRSLHLVTPSPSGAVIVSHSFC